MEVQINLNDIAFMVGSTVICLAPILGGLWLWSGYRLVRRK